MAEQTGRSLRLSAEEQAKANNALSKFGSKADLAAQLKMSRTTINNFFKGEPVQRKQFHVICKKLKLDWQPELPKQPLTDFSNLDALVQEIRDRIRPIIQGCCGTMNVLKMSQPIELDDIYTHVNILEKITGRKRLELTELLQHVSPEEFERFSLGAVKEDGVPGLEAVEKHSKLMIFGKPGAGKTTFLKHLAIKSIGGAFQPHRVPIFITLKDFAETDGQPNLLVYIDSLISSTAEVNSRSPLQTQRPIQQILDNGRALILLDGLDEVRETDASRILRQIQQFSDRYSYNAFVITCRIAASEYKFPPFTEVEVADFNDTQIANFSSKWFHCKRDAVKADRFVQKLKQNPPIRELASSPLLLTLLCLVFEDSGDFPVNRAELYEDGMNVLLKEWDTTRNIERAQIYKKLSLKRKQDLLSQIAYDTFEAGNYFFKQKDLERQIRDFIQNLPGVSTDEQGLELDSEAVMKSIEAQHGLFVERARGIYSFSHLTFHEYFAARYIDAKCNPSSMDDSLLNTLVRHVTNKRWREVFLLTTEMIYNADSLISLMKKHIDNLVSLDYALQDLLNWLEKRADSIDEFYKAPAIRDIYLFVINAASSSIHRFFDDLIVMRGGFDLAYRIDKRLKEDFENDSYRGSDELVIDLALSSVYELMILLSNDYNRSDINKNPQKALANDVDSVDIDVDSVDTFDFSTFINKILSSIPGNLKIIVEIEGINISTHNLIKELLQELPVENVTSTSDFRNFYLWMDQESPTWIEKLRQTITCHRNIQCNWQFTKEQIQLIQTYYNANLLLVDCLNSDCNISRSVREEIDETLLLPIAEIEKRKIND